MDAAPLHRETRRDVHLCRAPLAIAHKAFDLCIAVNWAPSPSGYLAASQAARDIASWIKLGRSHLERPANEACKGEVLWWNGLDVRWASVSTASGLATVFVIFCRRAAKYTSFHIVLVSGAASDNAKIGPCKWHQQMPYAAVSHDRPPHHQARLR